MRGMIIVAAALGIGGILAGGISSISSRVTRHSGGPSTEVEHSAPPATGVEHGPATSALSDGLSGSVPLVNQTPAQPAADYEGHLTSLRKKLPDGTFHIVVQPPFVVIGDESEEMVARRASSTVKWAVDQLKTLYFKKDPPHIIDVWLFRDEESYRKNARALFGDEPDTPYGYYSEVHRALVMNIATGGGTLVHEIVHPFVHANFPDAPAWFNEGLGSLYEQSGTRDGRICGLTNWRLAGLQKAIRSGRLPSFQTLLSTSSYQFYEEDPGTNYAQARYLCYYLQEKGLLGSFYHTFSARHTSDPTGLETLKEILETGDLVAFQKLWEAYVANLTFP